VKQPAIALLRSYFLASITSVQHIEDQRFSRILTCFVDEISNKQVKTGLQTRSLTTASRTICSSGDVRGCPENGLNPAFSVLSPSGQIRADTAPIGNNGVYPRVSFSVLLQDDTPMSTLFATTVANAKPQDRDDKLSDGGGLYLLVRSNGTKLWRLN
jgi:hypothetical protein